MSQYLGEKSLDPGLALLSVFNRLCQLKDRLWKGKGGLFTEVGESTRVIASGSLKYPTFSCFSSPLYMPLQSVGAAMLLLCHLLFCTLCPFTFAHLVFPQGGFMAGLISGLPVGSEGVFGGQICKPWCTLMPSSQSACCTGCADPFCSAGVSSVPNALVQLSCCSVVSF